MDPYRKHQFVHGHTITPEEMQDIDNGIDAVNKEATRLELAKVDKVEGMGLSKNNYSDEDKQKVQNAATTENVSKLENEVERHAFGEQSGSRNLWDEKTESGYINTSGAEVEESASIRGANFRECKPSTQYYGVSVNRKVLNLAWYDSSKTFISRVNAVNTSVTSPSNARYFKPSLNDYGAVYNHDIAIMEGTSGTYEPYIASNAQLTESEEKSEVRDAELRVLGWNVPSEMTLKNTVENGVLTQKVGRVDLGAKKWSRIATTVSGKYRFSYNIEDVKQNSTSTSFCSIYNKVGSTSTATDTGYLISGSYVYVYDSSKDTISADSFTASVSGKYLYYELATPIQHNITDMPSMYHDVEVFGIYDRNDGQFAQGAWSGGSIYGSLSNYIASKTKYPCNAGDLVEIVCDGTATMTTILFWSDYNTTASYKDVNGQTQSQVAPSGTQFVTFNIQRTGGITPNDAGVCKGIYINHPKHMISDEWNYRTSYTVGSYVIYQNRLFKCLIANSGQNPLTASTYWQMVKITDIVGSGGGGTGAWTEIGSRSGAGNVNVTASQYSEFLVVVKNADKTWRLTIASAEMTSTKTEAVTGEFNSSQYNSSVSIYFTNTYIQFGVLHTGSGDKTSSSTMTIYAR